MARGRKHGSDHRERLLGSLGYGRQGHVVTSADLSDLGEEDVWSTVAANDVGGEEASDDSARRSSGGSGGNRVRDDRAVRTRGWLSAKEERHHVGGISPAFEGARDSPSRGSHRQNSHVASSVPINVPDWPKILRVDSVESLQAQTEFEGNGDDGGEWVPPHEYLAREHSTSGKMVATSVFEGVGRTLKGRDMSRVRDAVWSRTGFFG